MADPFPYEKAMARVNRELEALVARLWEDFSKAQPKQTCSTTEEKAYSIIDFDSWGRTKIKDDYDRMMLLLLNEIVYGVFWHSSNFLKPTEGKMAEENREFYAEIIIEQAKRAHLMKDMSAPGFKYGYSWIVEKYDDGTLTKYIPESLLREAVNRGFWEFVNEHFTTSDARFTTSFSVLDRYFRLLKYWEYLNLTRVDEFWVKPLSGTIPWPVSGYRKAFERVRQLLKDDQIEKLVAPIIDRIFEYVLKDQFKWDEKAPKELQDMLVPYMRYINMKQVQDLLSAGAVESLDHIYDEDSQSQALRNLRIYLGYIDLDQAGKARLISSALELPENRYEAVEILVNLGFPMELLTKEKRRELSGVLVEQLDAMVKFSVNPRLEPENEAEEQAKKSAKDGFRISTIDLASKAAGMGLLSRGRCKGIIEGQLQAYVESDVLPSKAMVNSWKELKVKMRVEPSLHQKFLRKVEQQVEASESRSRRAAEKGKEIASRKYKSF